MKKIIGLVMLFVASMITLISCGKVLAASWTEEDTKELMKVEEYLNEQYSEFADEFFDKVVVLVKH